MRYALIDNSTLTAVQRVLGEIPIYNKHIIDGDILALESFIQGVLFYDKIICINDYKEKYRLSRKKYFDKTMFLEKEDFNYDEFLSKAKEVTNSIVPSIEGGRFSDKDFRPFFEQLKMNTIFSWNMESSIFYLHMKMLESVGGVDLPKYSKLASMIIHELSDKTSMGAYDISEPAKIKLFDAKGNVINSQYTLKNKNGDALEQSGMSRQMKTFISGLNWLALRTVFYTLIGEKLKVDIMLHPIRNAFQYNTLTRIHRQNPSKFKPILDAMNGVASENINKIFNKTQPTVIQQPMPMYTAWLAEKIKDPANFIEAIYEIRTQDVFQQARNRLTELEEYISLQSDHQKFVKEGNKLVQEIEKQMERIRIKFGVQTPSGVSTSRPIFIYNMFALAGGIPGIPALAGKFEKLDFLNDCIPRKGFCTVYRNMINDLSQISSLGKYYEIISKNVKLEKDASYIDMKTEKPCFQNSEYWWKVKM